MTTLQIRSTDGTIGHVYYSPFEQSVLGYLAQSHLSDMTRLAYTADLQQWLAYCQLIELDPTFATRGHLDTYVRWMSEHPRGWSESTINRRIGTVCGVYKYGHGEEILVKDPGARVKRPKVDMTKQRQTYLVPTEFAIFVKYVSRHGTVMEKALVAFLGLRGMRITEALSLNIGDYYEQGGYRLVKFIGKGGKARVVQVPPAAVAAVTDAIGDRTAGPILLNRRGNPLDRGTAASWLKVLARAADVDDDIACHSMRRSYATMARSRGIPLEDLSESLGHASTSTTVRYDKQRGSLDRDISAQVSGMIVGLGG